MKTCPSKTISRYKYLLKKVSGTYYVGEQNLKYEYSLTIVFTKYRTLITVGTKKKKERKYF